MCTRAVCVLNVYKTECFVPKLGAIPFMVITATPFSFSQLILKQFTAFLLPQCNTEHYNGIPTGT